MSGGVAAAALVAIGAGCGESGSGGVTYHKDILPIVVEHCAGCHGI